MNKSISKTALLTLLLAFSGAANADFGVGVKAGSLGLGLEGRWSPIPWFDLRMGVNQYDYDMTGSQAGIDYNATLAMDTYFLTTNFRFPLSPFRLTAGAYSNGNALQMSARDTGGALLGIGGSQFDTAVIGNLQSKISFDSNSPYLGIGYDFEVFGKFGLNLDLGVLWQGEPNVEMYVSGYDALPGVLQTQLNAALAIERLELEDEISDYEVWPVFTLSFIYNF